MNEPKSTGHARETAREEAVNVPLGAALWKRGIHARAERRSGGDAPDIRFDLPSGDQVIVECKWETGRTALDAQLDQRVHDFPESLARVGILYPDELKHIDDIAGELERTVRLRWFLHSTKQNVYENPTVHDGGLDQLADDLRTLPQQIEGADQVSRATEDVRLALNDAAAAINKHANIGRRIADVIAQADQEDDRAAALRIGCLVLFNALAFQERLSAINEDVPTATQSAKPGASELREVWDTICREIDYVPVFEIAIEILRILSDAPFDLQHGAIEPLVKAVRKTDHIEGHDLAGRLFHTLLTDAKFTGTYYTSIPAATVLTRLVFDGWPPNVDWSDHEFPASLNVADLACGTGTLLMAVAAEAERRHLNAGGANAPLLHKAMVEEALHGYDVQLSAIHFAATSLAMLNPRIEFDSMNLYVMSLEAKRDAVALGSVDFLGVDSAPVQHSISAEAFGIETPEPEQVTGGGVQTATGSTVRLPELDLAIMNPPYTRPGLMLLGMKSADERRKMQQELSRRLKKRRGSAISGLGASFVATAAPKLRQGQGRLALVLPITLCTGSSWQQTRQLIERDFKLEMVIASHDPERWLFSDSTDLSELLLIATRRADGDVDMGHRTTYVNLWRNPDAVIDARRTADAIARTSPAQIEDPGTALLSLGGQHVGEAVSVPMSRFADRKWAGIQFARADLLRAALSLTEDGEVQLPGITEVGSIPICQLSDLGSIGPDRRDILDGFEQTKSVTAYPMVAGNDTDQWRGLSATPNRYLSALSRARPRRRLKPAPGLWAKSARLLIAERIRLDTIRLVAMCATQPVLSNVFWEVKAETEQQEQALALWLNSSLGLLTLMATRTTTEGGWVSIKKGDLGRMPVLNVRALSAKQLADMSTLFWVLAEDSFERLPNMVDCPTRTKLDDGLAEILDLPNLSVLRTLLASEPVVSNRRL